MSAGNFAKMKRPSAAAREPTLAVVEISATKTKYYVHRSLLIEHSEYFNKALNGPWKEAQEGVVTLEDVDCSTFDIFVDWLYTQRLPKDDDGWIDGQKLSNATCGEYMLARIKAFVFGDRFLASIFRRAVRDDLIASMIDDGGVEYEPIIYAFANLSSDNPILDLMVDTHCRSFEEAYDNEENGELERRLRLPHAFLLRAMLRYSRFKDGWDEEDLDPCDYHGHASEEEKKECQEGRVSKA